MVDKTTHDSYRIDLFAPVMKSAEGKYLAVLSDNSIDRDDEIVTEKCINKLGKDIGYVAGLIDHDNSVLKMVAEWINRRTVEIDGHKALIAEPKFFLSNPNAKIIKNMLDEGAKIGISIGAIVKDCEEIDGRKTYTDLELLEASFVAIPSNKHGRVMAVAKSFNKNKKREDPKMELTNKDLEVAVKETETKLNKEFNEQLEKKDSEISKLKKELEEAKEESEKQKEDAEKKVKEVEEKLKSTEEALEKEKKQALEKMNYAKGDLDKQPNKEEVEKSLNDGKLPVLNII